MGKSVVLRTYYNNADIQSVIDSASAKGADIQTIEGVKFYLLPISANIFNNTHGGALYVIYSDYGQTSSDSTWTEGSWNDKSYAEYSTKYLRAGGLATAGGTGEPFPTELIDLSATNSLAFNEVKWSIRNNVGNRTFDLERSRDSVNFALVGSFSKEEAYKTDSTALYFNLNDYQIFGKTFYRLKIINEKGLAAYSHVIKVNVQDTILIYPNPTEDQLNIIYSYRLFKSPYNVKVINMAGQVVWNEQIESEDGAGIIRLNMSALPSGVYIINAVDSLNQYLGQSRFIKR